MKKSRWNVPWHWFAVFACALCVTGCTTTSKHVVFNDSGIVVTHTEQTDHALKMSGHGGYVLVINSAVVYGKEYPVLAGDGSCLLAIPDRKLVFFVCAIPGSSSGFLPDRELHIVHTGDRSDTAIFLGQSNMGDDFGQHQAGTKYAPEAEFESDQRLRITTYSGRTAFAPVYEPSTRSVFVVSLAEKKLISQSKIPIPEPERAKPNEPPEPTIPSGRGSS